MSMKDKEFRFHVDEGQILTKVPLLLFLHLNPYQSSITTVVPVRQKRRRVRRGMERWLGLSPLSSQ